MREFVRQLLKFALFVVVSTTAIVLALNGIAWLGHHESLHLPHKSNPRPSVPTRLTRLGINPVKDTCPDIKPEKLPPDALAGASKAALAQAPPIFRWAQYPDAEDWFAAAAWRAAAFRSSSLQKLFDKGIRETCHDHSSRLFIERSVVVAVDCHKDCATNLAALPIDAVVARFHGKYEVWLTDNWSAKGPGGKGWF